MPSASRSTTPVGIDLDIVEGRYAELDDHTVSFETFKQDLDTTPYFRGLPGDACTCRHVGYVTAGQITFRWPDREETYVEGDAYVAGPGHRPLIAAGTSVVEFSPTADLQPVMEAIGRNIEALAGVRVMTTAPVLPMVEGEVAELAQRLVTWLETAVRPENLFADDVFADLTLPHWRLQAQGADGAFHLREDGHPCAGEVRVEALDRTARGFLIQFEERWTDADGQRWYCREMIHCIVAGGRVSELVAFCTGDWDEARQLLHAQQVRLIRP